MVNVKFNVTSELTLSNTIVLLLIIDAVWFWSKQVKYGMALSIVYIREELTFHTVL